MTTATATEPIELRDLCCGYGDITVVRDVNLTVSAGEIVALLGPNGAGKTTLLLTAAGFLKPLGGTVTLFGSPRRLPTHKQIRRGLAFIGEDRHVFPSLSVAQTLKLVDGGAAGAIERFPQLAALRSRRTGLLSGGEQQMLALGRALAARPRLVIVDELSLGLAPMVRDRLLDILRAAADDGAAVLIVEQSAPAALRVADRVCILRRGEVVETAPAARWRGRLDELGRAFLS